MSETTYNLEGRIGTWSAGNFVVKEVDGDTPNPRQVFQVVPTLNSSYNPTPDFLARHCKPGEHVCYWGNFFSQGEGNQVRVELRVAPPLNGYVGLKMLTDLVAHKKIVAASFEEKARVDLIYVSPHLIEGKVPAFLLKNPIYAEKPLTSLPWSAPRT
jgi:hypothetical protein